MVNFDGIFAEVKDKPKEQQKEIHIDIKDSFTLNMNNFLTKFKEESNSMSDNELYELVKATYDMVLESTVAKKDTVLAITLFNNARYITALTNVLNTVKLTYSQKVYCNKLAYDYFRIPGEKDQVIIQLLQNLSNTVNFDIIPSLIGDGIPKDLASYIALARYSSIDEYITVKRVNSLIFNFSNDMMTEQRIINIYQTLYSECMTKLFKGIILDVYSVDLLNKSTSQSQEIYSLIGLAVLTMVNTMPYSDIKTILKSYYGDYINFPSATRFSMQSLSDDYSRINDVIYDLKINEDINLP